MSEVPTGHLPSGPDALAPEDPAVESLTGRVGPRAEGRGQGWSSTLRPAVLAAGAFAVAYTAATVADYNPRSPLLPVASKAVLAVLVVAVAAAWLARGRLRKWAPDVTAALVSAFTGAILAAALHGSDYPVAGLWVDTSLRIAAVTRLSETGQLVDFVYRGLPAFYPPLMPWVVGRLAALFDLAPYSALKDASILMAFAVPLVSYLQWRRLVSPALAALISVGAPLAVSYFDQQPEAWLALFATVPWWLDAVYGLRRGGVRSLPVWAYGLIGAALFCLYYYYFFILAIALALVVVLDRLHRPRDARPWRRRLGVLGIAAGLSAVYWLPLLVSIVAAQEPASLQNRWFSSAAGHTELAVDIFDGSVVGFLMLAGLTHLTWTVRRHRLSAGLLLVLAAGYTWYVLGFGLAAAGLPVLAFRTEPFVELVLIVAGIRAGRALVRVAAEQWDPANVSRLAAVLAGALVFALGQAYIDDLVDNRWVELSHNTPRADGRVQPYTSSRVEPPKVPMARMVELVRAAHGGDGRPVVLSTRIDFLIVSPMYGFNSWAAIYAHPAGEFRARLELTRRMARERDPARFAALARRNRFDPIDVFVLRSSARGRLVYKVRSVDFPRRHQTVPILFTRDQFDGRYWKVMQAGKWFIAASR